MAWKQFLIIYSDFNVFEIYYIALYRNPHGVSSECTLSAFWLMPSLIPLSRLYVEKQGVFAGDDCFAKGYSAVDLSLDSLAELTCRQREFPFYSMPR
jgi:hypothetical protein